MLTCVCFRARPLGVESVSATFSLYGLGANHLTFLCLSFLLSKTFIIIPTS